MIGSNRRLHFSRWIRIETYDLFVRNHLTSLTFFKFLPLCSGGQRSKGIVIVILRKSKKTSGIGEPKNRQTNGLECFSFTYLLAKTAKLVC